jgi:hypothetical protein
MAKVNIARQDTLEETLQEVKNGNDTIEEILNIVKTEAVYGFIEHEDTFAPGSRIEYIGVNANYNPIKITMGGGYSLGDWATFPWLQANKPYMVNSDGSPAYRLNENDYTKKENGTDSDVANTDFDGGAFSWGMKIYKKEYKAGNDRYVLFRFEKADGFEPVGFLDPDNNELEGVWIPMFYGSIVDEKMRSTSGLQPVYNKTTAEERTAIQKFSTRAHHLGGPIVETLIDLMTLFAKTTALQSVYGAGNCSGYDASLTPTMGVKQNAVISGGQFYGTSDEKSLNKIFHSVVLGSYQQYMRDPFEIVVNGRVRVSKNYAYDITGASYEDTGINVDNDGNWRYAHKHVSVPGYGPVPVGPYNGSSVLGDCDGTYISNNQKSMTAVALRFGHCCGGVALSGPRARNWNFSATSASWYIGAANLLLPPVGVAV